MSDLKVIDVSGNPGYRVTIGQRSLDQLAELLGPDVRKVLIVHSPRLGAKAAELRQALGRDFDAYLAEVPDAEGAKRIEVAGFIWQVLAQAGFSRNDAVVGFGGGATTDLAGFVASTFMRGISCVQIPTSVAGMVDAAIGGKTAINIAEGKNLVGTFAEPQAVVVDPLLLDTLPQNETVAGLAEVVKVGFIADPSILDLVENDPTGAVDVRSGLFATIVERAIRVKARVVGADFTETGQREVLNYGHTLGHAIEHHERYLWRHGAAISIGMVFAAELSRLTRGLRDDVVDRHRAILGALGLPLSYPVETWPALLQAMRSDKKVRAGALRFVLLDDIARPVVHYAPDESLLFAAYQEVAQQH